MSTPNKPYWVDYLTIGDSDGGLGKITYSHVHGDGSEHPTQVDTPTGAWTSTPGLFSPDVKVMCQGCRAVMGPDDRITVQRKEAVMSTEPGDQSDLRQSDAWPFHAVADYLRVISAGDVRSGRWKPKTSSDAYSDLMVDPQVEFPWEPDPKEDDYPVGQDPLDDDPFEDIELDYLVGHCVCGWRDSRPIYRGDEADRQRERASLVKAHTSSEFKCTLEEPNFYSM